MIEFARELGSETNLDEMLRSVADRLLHTLSIQHVAFFLAGENDDRVSPAHDAGQSQGAEPWEQAADELDLSFLSSRAG